MQGKLERRLFYPSLVIVLFACLLLADCFSYYTTTFDEKVWLKSGVKGRGRMADDVVNRRLLVGKTKPEILAMLGMPDRGDVEIIEYKVAHIPRCSWIWGCYLGIQFDQTGKATQAFISD